MRLVPQTYALTAICFQRLRVFQRTVNAELMVTPVLSYRDEGRFLLHGFVVMPDHVHLLATPSESIEKTAQLVKGGFSFAVRKQYFGEVGQTSYFAHRVTDENDFAAQLGYIANNPRRKGYEDYPHVHTGGTWRMDDAPGLGKKASPGAKALFVGGRGCRG